MPKLRISFKSIVLKSFDFLLERYYLLSDHLWDVPKNRFFRENFANLSKIHLAVRFQRSKICSSCDQLKPLDP